jgi:hypothetical protein
MSDDSIENKEYEVGYKKPPKSGQFQPGQSGNPRGTSKAVRARKAKKGTFGMLFTEGMQRPVDVEENGRKVTITRMHLAIRRRAEEAAKGNVRALKELLKLRDVKESGPLAPGRRLVLTLDEARAAGPLGYGLYRPEVTIIRDPKPAVAGEAPKPKPRPAEPELPRRSVKELIEIEFDREIRVTDAATGTARRMTIREVIAEQLMLLFMAGKSGVADLMIKLNTKMAFDKDEFRKIYIGVPWNYVMPPRCDMQGRPVQTGERASAPSVSKPGG